MNWRISILILYFSALSCQKETGLSLTSHEGYLISASEVMAINKNENFKILDFRKEVNYLKDHISGAIQIWRKDIENPNFEYGGMMPSKEQVENLFSNLGIATTDYIIIYDDNGLCEAARLWWILQNYDFNKVKLLQGGLPDWKSAGGKVDTITPSYPKSEFILTNQPSMKYFASKKEVKNAIKNQVTIIDTRSTDEFMGIYHKKGAAKPGRISNSLHIDWAAAINYHGDKSLKSIVELEKTYNNRITTKSDPIILYCHSGVRSAHTTFVLTQLLGYENVRNYDGSWTEWSHFDELPIENESLTFN